MFSKLFSHLVTFMMTYKQFNLSLAMKFLLAVRTLKEEPSYGKDEKRDFNEGPRVVPIHAMNLRD